MNSKLNKTRRMELDMIGRGLCSVALLLALSLTSGCGKVDGPPRAAVQGRILLNGLPMSAGVVRFVPHGDTKGPKVTAVVELGRFELDESRGPLVGEHRVEIELRDNSGIAVDDEEALRRLAQTPRSQRSELKVERIPACYNRRSELVAKISPENVNDLKFELNCDLVASR